MQGDRVDHLVIDFESHAVPEDWRAVNDGVMGGLSMSRMQAGADGTAVFCGELSLENNGGFASVRAALDEVDLSDHDGVILRVRGDGRTYQVRFRTDIQFKGVTYRAHFATKAGQWIHVKVAFSRFEPVYRGRPFPGAVPLDTTCLHQIAFMVADEKEGPFRLEIAWVKAFVENEPGDLL
jgi:monofunctional biosynthetic peptidoglycan transglycosylase